jgi:hypothetical protein
MGNKQATIPAGGCFRDMQNSIHKLNSMNETVQRT